MRSTVWAIRCLVTFLAVSLCVGVASLAEPPAKSDSSSIANEKSVASDKSKVSKAVSVEVARQRAKLTHNIYSATLDVMHHRYFRNERASVPARALEDVFSEISRLEKIKARWIVVNATAMNIDHRPRDDFEKKAAKAIAAGKREFELVENGIYRRAEGISLMNKGCLGCHLRLGASGKVKRFAGLVISIPVTKK